MQIEIELFLIENVLATRAYFHDKFHFGMSFEIIGEIENVQTIAIGKAIRDIKRIRKQFGSGRWRKLKGIATIKLFDGTIRRAELHWYEAHGVGKKKIKIKAFID